MDWTGGFWRRFMAAKIDLTEKISMDSSGHRWFDRNLLIDLDFRAVNFSGTLCFDGVLDRSTFNGAYSTRWTFYLLTISILSSDYWICFWHFSSLLVCFCNCNELNWIGVRFKFEPVSFLKNTAANLRVHDFWQGAAVKLVIKIDSRGLDIWRYSTNG